MTITTRVQRAAQWVLENRSLQGPGHQPKDLVVLELAAAFQWLPYRVLVRLMG